MDGTCRRGQPCPKASALAARDHLVRMIGKPVGVKRDGHILVKATPLKCWSMGNGRGTRTAAWCRTGQGIDLSCSQVQAGVALRWHRYGGDRVCKR